MLSDEQKKNRIGRVGSSEVAALIGMNEFSSPFDVVARLITEQDGGVWDSGFTGNAATVRGDIVEEGLVRMPPMYDSRLTLAPGDFRVHPRFDWLGSHIDSLYVEGGSDVATVGAECKSAGTRQAAKWSDWSTDLNNPAPVDGVETKARVQGMIHLACRPELQRLYWIALLATSGGAMEVGVYHIHRRDAAEEIGMIEDKVASAYEAYVVRREPAPKGKSSDETIKQMYPTATQHALPVDEMPEVEQHMSRLVNQHVEWGEIERDAKEKRRELGNEIKTTLGEYDGAEGHGWRVSWKNTKGRLKTNHKELIAELGDSHPMVQKYTSIVPGARVLRCTVK